jgi:hypothetical protein
LRAGGPRECAPDERLREAIHRAGKWLVVTGLLDFTSLEGIQPATRALLCMGLFSIF